MHSCGSELWLLDAGMPRMAPGEGAGRPFTLPVVLAASEGLLQNQH